MIAIIKYNAGNATSVANAIGRLGEKCMITSNKNEILNADKVIFPGVGAASTAMEFLQETGLDQTIKSIQTPFLGICLGLQLMCTHSEEGDTTCLGIFDTKVKRFPSITSEKVPHVGWNNFKTNKSPLFEGICTEDDMYYVHSFYAEFCPNTIASCDYILPFSCSIQKDNFLGVQFHPEKSSTVGARLLQNFCALTSNS